MEQEQRILLIEDSPGDKEIYSMKIRESCPTATLDVAQNVSQAVDLLEGNTYTAIVFDSKFDGPVSPQDIARMQSFGIDIHNDNPGLEVLKAIRQDARLESNRPSHKFYHSSQMTPATAAQAERLGAEVICRKSNDFDYPELEQFLENLTHKHGLGRKV